MPVVSDKNKPRVIVYKGLHWAEGSPIAPRPADASWYACSDGDGDLCAVLERILIPLLHTVDACMTCGEMDGAIADGTAVSTVWIDVEAPIVTMTRRMATTAFEHIVWQHRGDGASVTGAAALLWTLRSTASMFRTATATLDTALDGTVLLAHVHGHCDWCTCSTAEMSMAQWIVREHEAVCAEVEAATQKPYALAAYSTDILDNVRAGIDASATPRSVARTLMACVPIMARQQRLNDTWQTLPADVVATVTGALSDVRAAQCAVLALPVPRNMHGLCGTSDLDDNQQMCNTMRRVRLAVQELTAKRAVRMSCVYGMQLHLAASVESCVPGCFSLYALLRLPHAQVQRAQKSLDGPGNAYPIHKQRKQVALHNLRTDPFQ